MAANVSANLFASRENLELFQRLLRGLSVLQNHDLEGLRKHMPRERPAPILPAPILNGSTTSLSAEKVLQNAEELRGKSGDGNDDDDDDDEEDDIDDEDDDRIHDDGGGGDNDEKSLCEDMLDDESMCEASSDDEDTDVIIIDEYLDDDIGDQDDTNEPETNEYLEDGTDEDTDVIIISEDGDEIIRNEDDTDEDGIDEDDTDEDDTDEYDTEEYVEDRQDREENDDMHDEDDNTIIDIDIDMEGENSRRDSRASSPRIRYPTTNQGYAKEQGQDQEGTSERNSDLRCWEHGCNGRKFSTRSNLVRHRIENSKARPVCSCPQCGAVFSRTTARNQHVARGSCNRIRRYSNGRIRPSFRVKDS